MKILMLGSGSIKSNFTYRLLALGKALRQRGHRVAIITPKADKYNNFVPEKIDNIDGVRILQPFQFATKRLEVNLLPYMFAAARLVLREKPDLVYIYKPTPISLVGLIARLRRIPVILDMDDLGSEVMKIEGHPLHQRKLVEWSERLAARWATGIITASTFLQQHYAGMFPKKSVLWVPNGVELDWFGPVQAGRRKKQIVFMGSLNRKSILEPLFDVLPKVLKKHPSTHVLIIGDGQYMEYFKSKAKELKLEKHIIFTGWLPLAQARLQLHAGDIGYNYMPDELTVRAASNMKVPQYMARGVVPLVSNVGDLPEAVAHGKAGYVVAADDPDALEQALSKALADADRPKKAIRARRHARQTFDWAKLAKGVDEWLQATASGLLTRGQNRSLLKYLLRHYIAVLAAGLGLVNLLVWSGQDVWHVGHAFVGMYMLVAPGLLLLAFLANKKLPWALGIAFSAALSIALIMGVGLLVNVALPWVGVSAPLRTAVLLPAFDVLVLALLACNIWRLRPIPLKGVAFMGLDRIVLAGALLMPVLAVLGATSLNNGGSNLFVMTSLGLIAGYVPLLILLNKRLGVAVMPLVLYLAALSLLLMNSMRGWFITGHDVLREYHVFQLTDTAGRWDIAAFRDPYNACLSITILPVYLQHLLHIDPAYIYKFVFQFIGALPVIPIFYLFRRYTSAIVAFLASFTYISFPAFIVDMSMLNRQGVAFLFFSLLLYVLLTNLYIVRWQRSVVLLLFGAGMIVSHYSTSYVAVSLLVLGYVVNRVLRWGLGRKNQVNKIESLLRIHKLPNRAAYRQPVLLGLPVVIGLLVMAALWNGPITQTSKGVTMTVKQIAVSLQEPFKGSDNTSVRKTPQKQPSTKEALFGIFTREGIEQERTPNAQSNLFPLGLSQAPQYQTTAIDEPAIPANKVGSALDRWLPLTLGSLYTSIKQSYAKILQLLLLVGLAAMLFGYSFKRRLERQLPAEYLALSIAGVLFMAFQVVVPASGINYGLLRLIQQNLMLLALPITLGFLLLVGLGSRKLTAGLFAYGAVLVAFFGILTGFVPQLIGEGRPALALNNNGLYYDAYYTHAEEVASFVYLQSVHDPRYSLQADRYFTALKLHAYTGMNASGSRLLPATTKRNSFVLLGTTNVTESRVVEYQDGEIVYYTLPLNFFDDNKNLIYSTGGSAVYW